VSVVEPVSEVLLPEPLVVPVPVAEPEPLTEPEPVPEPEPLVVPVRVDDPSEQPDNPRPRLNDITAADNKYLWLRIVPPFYLAPTVTLT
jgi:fused signal recognition particle receptor